MIDVEDDQDCCFGTPVLVRVLEDILLHIDDPSKVRNAQESQLNEKMTTMYESLGVI
jgi:hypothetical protein